MPKQLIGKIALSLVSLLLAVFAIEVASRFLIAPSQASYGTLFGHELPPFRVIPSIPPQRVDRSEPYGDLIVSGERITVGDLQGAYEEDPLVGHIPLENWSSTHGWWINNNVGARAVRDVLPGAPADRTRVLVFGDSFAVGLGVPQEQAWSDILQRRSPSVEYLNFGVAGYGMGQSVLRYRQIRSAVEHDLALLVFVPSASLWRDVNTVRAVGEEGWLSYQVMPRFVVERNRLRLVGSPYQSSSAAYADNREGTSDTLRSHLIAYDRFYFPAKFEGSWLLDRSVIFKSIVKTYYDEKRRALRRSLLRPDSEAAQVARALAVAMSEDAREVKARFALIVMPAHRDLDLLAGDGGYERSWASTVDVVCGDGIACIDLTEALRRAPEGELDRSFDGGHYGPKANARIAAVLAEPLTRIVSDSPSRD